MDQVGGENECQKRQDYGRPQIVYRPIELKAEATYESNYVASHVLSGFPLHVPESLIVILESTQVQKQERWKVKPKGQEE